MAAARMGRFQVVPERKAAKNRLHPRIDPDAFRDASQGQIRADPDRRGPPAAAAWDMSTTTAT
jgi:hypothetical protein